MVNLFDIAYLVIVFPLGILVYLVILVNLVDMVNLVILVILVNLIILLNIAKTVTLTGVFTPFYCVFLKSTMKSES